MPMLTRESRALLSFALALALLVGGSGAVTTAVWAGLGALLPSGYDPSLWISLLGVIIAAAVAVLALGPARVPTHDVWRHLAVAALWLALIQVVIGLLTVVGAWTGTWPGSPLYGWTA